MARSVGQTSAPLSNVLIRPFERRPSRVASSSWDQPFDFRHNVGCIGGECSAIQNTESSRDVLQSGGECSYNPDHARLMSDAAEPDWYFQDWMRHFDKRQASLVNELGWERSKASDVWHGVRPYRRSVVNEIAGWLDLQPYELLMPPHEALKLRELRSAAHAIAASHPIVQAAAPGPMLVPRRNS